MSSIWSPLAWARKRIAVKAAFLFVSLFALFAALMLAVNVWSERQDQTLRTFALAHAYATHAEATIERDGAIVGETVDTVLNDIFATGDVLAIRVVDDRGRVIDQRGSASDSYPPDEAELANEAIMAGEPKWEEIGGLAVVARPLALADGRSGAVLLGRTMAPVRAAVADVYRRGLLLTLFGIAFVIPVTGLFVSRALRPIRELTDAAQQAARGRLDVRVETGSGDELETLAEGFNVMLDRLKGSLEHVRRLAYSDHLTGLPNKSAFGEHARRVLQSGEERGGAMFLIDLDRFKRLNDTLGAKQGDRLIRSVGERMKSVLARHEKRMEKAGYNVDAELSRITGDEFALIAAGFENHDDVEALARDFVSAISAPVDVAGQQVVVSCSVGIAEFPEHGTEPDLLLRNANLAMDAAKKAGGAVYRFFDTDMTRAAVDRMTLENELRRGIENHEFIVHYQPKVAARTGRVTGSEALIRWRLPDGSIRSPGQFIGVAEETGLIAEMGDFVLQESCRAAARWREKGFEVPVSVNVSALQFERDDFRRKVHDALNAANLPPQMLELEITESVAMTDPERAIAQIQPLRDEGVRFAIDDFGTGHSSLSHLTRMPFDTFKIDQSFVQNLDSDPNARVIVQTILALARSLQLETVAEGAETAEHVAMLQGLGCATIQGFYFAKPMPERDFVDYAESGPKLEPLSESSVLRINPAS